MVDTVPLRAAGVEAGACAEAAGAAEAEEEPLHREGYRGGTWVLLDYGCIAIHVFNQEAREFYGLERLWQDGKPVDISGIVDEHD